DHVVGGVEVDLPAIFDAREPAHVPDESHATEAVRPQESQGRSNRGVTPVRADNKAPHDLARLPVPLLGHHAPPRPPRPPAAAAPADRARPGTRWRSRTTTGKPRARSTRMRSRASRGKASA